jgi:sugar/nucleoside kinase (ribokinase family)
MARAHPSIVAVGDAIVDVATSPVRDLPGGDAQLLVPRVSLLAGGNATNFALQAAALGADVRFFGCVGADPFGEFLRRAFAAGRVAAALRVDPTRPTGTTTAIAREDGSRILITAPGANDGLREADVPRTAFDGADHVHRAGFWWTGRLQGRPTVRILSRARGAGATTSLDIATDPSGWTSERLESVRSALPEVTTFFCNEPEVTAIAGIRDPIRAASAACRLGAEEVVLHRGGRGAAWVRGSRVLRSGAFPSRAENPTGCGDVFNAAFVVARLRGHEVRRSLRFANACAALHLRHADRPYPPDRAVARLAGPARRARSR